jgi:hypothetical protein
MRSPVAELEAAVALVAVEVSPIDLSNSCSVTGTLTEHFSGRGATYHRSADDRHPKNIAP